MPTRECQSPVPDLSIWYAHDDCASFAQPGAWGRAAAELRSHHDQVHLIIEAFLLFFLIIAKLLFPCTTSTALP